MIEDRAKEKAKEKQKASGGDRKSESFQDRQTGGENFTPPIRDERHHEESKSKSIAARAVGMSRPTLAAAQKVVEKGTPALVVVADAGERGCLAGEKVPPPIPVRAD